MSTPARPRARSRSDSLQSALSQVPLHEYQAGSPAKPDADPAAVAAAPVAAAVASEVKPLPAGNESAAARRAQLKRDRWDLGDARGIPASFGFWEDLWTGRWMVIPSSSGTLLLFTLSLYINWHLCATYIGPALGIVGLPKTNPFAPLWTISYALPLEPGDIGTVKYGKGVLDLVFLLHHIITFSFLRQSITLYILRPWALRLGINKQAKIARFMEQSYSALYYGTAGCTGVYLMYHYLPTWYFNTSEFWLAYPHWRMVGLLKYYYLLQFSYWLQQMLILIAKIEKPRKDYRELVIHHWVTLWLIGWSYAVNLTMIGNAIFITMDVSDVFLAIAKCVNYAEGKKSSGFWSTVCFAWFVVVWTYLRHWLNIRILWSVWYEFDLIPAYTRFFDPPTGHWLAPWMRYQIFVPIFLIQLLNAFWYYLILRILVRTVRGKVIEDDRSEDEEDEPTVAADKQAKVENKKQK